jgi:hypothetical protein
MWRICVVFVVSVFCSGVHAAPLAYFSLEGRKQGSEDPFSANVEVAVGDVIEYRLRSQMATVGVTNRFLSAEAEAWHGGHGFNSLSISLRQEAGDGIEVDLNSPVNLDPQTWGSHFTSGGGTPTARVGGNGHDLLGIRPILQPGVFRGAADETIFTGRFEITKVMGTTGLVSPAWGPDAGGGAYFGRIFFLTPAGYEQSAQSEGSEDPVAHFTPLTLTSSLAAVPEPGTLALIAIGMIPFGVLCFRRAGRSNRRTALS